MGLVFGLRRDLQMASQICETEVRGHESLFAASKLIGAMAKVQKRPFFHSQFWAAVCIFWIYSINLLYRCCVHSANHCSMHMFYLSSRVTDEARSIWEKGFLILESFFVGRSLPGIECLCAHVLSENGLMSHFENHLVFLVSPSYFPTVVCIYDPLCMPCTRSPYWEILRGQRNKV